MSIAQPNKDRKHFHITDNTQGVLTLRFMPIPVNIEQLLGATSIESSRIEYKKGWNPDAIYRTICAFANDIDNTGGGYIIIGVEERNGRPIRPVKGLSLEEIEPIEREMIGFNNLIRPIYYPRTSIEDVDGKKVLVIWVPGGPSRPYKVPDEVTAKQKKHNFYIRYNSSSIIAKGEFEKELIELTNQIPFDDRVNMQASLKDISKTLVRDFLVKTKSRLADSIEESKFSDILQQMDLVAGPPEAMMPKKHCTDDVFGQSVQILSVYTGGHCSISERKTAGSVQFHRSSTNQGACGLDDQRSNDLSAHKYNKRAGNQA